MVVRFVLLPTKKIAREAARLADKAARYGKTVRKVDNRKYLSHITLFSLKVTKKSIPVLRVVLKDIKPPFVRLVGYWQHSKNNTLGLNVKNVSELDRFRKKLYKIITKLDDVKGRLKKNYDPHITLVVYDQKEPREVIRQFSTIYRNKFKAVALASVVSDRRGQFSKKDIIFETK